MQHTARKSDYGAGAACVIINCGKRTENNTTSVLWYTVYGLFNDAFHDFSGKLSGHVAIYISFFIDHKRGRVCIDAVGICVKPSSIHDRSEERRVGK